MDRLDVAPPFGWFVGLGIDDPVWDASSHARDRDRFLEIAGAGAFLAGVARRPGIRRQMRRDHFSVDGALVDAWASMKSFVPKDAGDRTAPPAGGRNAEGDFRGQRRSNGTHASAMDPDARL